MCIYIYIYICRRYTNHFAAVFLQLQNLLYSKKKTKMPTIGVAKYITSLFSISLIICE